MIDGRAAEEDAQAAGASGHDRAGVGTLPARTLGAPAGQGGAEASRQGIAQGGQPGRYPVEQVVQPRRRPAEAPVTVIAIAPHGVQGIGQAVEDDAGCAGHQVPEEGGEDGIVAVFQHGFDGCLGDALSVQVCGVAADDRSHRLPCLGQVPATQGCPDAVGMLAQAAPADGEVEHQQVQEVTPGLAIDEGGEQDRGQDEQEQGQSPAPAGVAMEAPLQG